MDAQPLAVPPSSTAPEPALSSLGDSTPCVHHWILGDPDRGVIVGHCKRCGAKRAFSGTPEGTFRFDDFRELTQSSTYFERSGAAHSPGPGDGARRLGQLSNTGMRRDPRRRSLTRGGPR